MRLLLVIASFSLLAIGCSSTDVATGDVTAHVEEESLVVSNDTESTIYVAAFSDAMLPTVYFLPSLLSPSVAPGQTSRIRAEIVDNECWAGEIAVFWWRAEYRNGSLRPGQVHHFKIPGPSAS